MKERTIRAKYEAFAGAAASCAYLAGDESNGAWRDCGDDQRVSRSRAYGGRIHTGVAGAAPGVRLLVTRLPALVRPRRPLHTLRAGGARFNIDDAMYRRVALMHNRSPH